MQPTQDINIHKYEPLIPPHTFKEQFPLSDALAGSVIAGRNAVKKILSGEDSRLMVVAGPCSIHDRKAAMEYARRLNALSHRVADRMCVIMRVYFEKPRTTVGWKGMINDPHLNDTFDIEAGMRTARQILIDIVELGLPTATEMLEPITPQYIDDLISLASIGARTTESPTHRQLASGLSMPVGYKNGTDGGLQVALDAMQACKAPHAFLGIDPEGRTCVIHTKGNAWGFIILRGGRSGPNYAKEHLRDAARRLEAVGHIARLVVDCSHANSNRDHSRQNLVWRDCIARRVAGNAALIGLMLESNLHAGNQKLTGNPDQLEYGVSITDACISWEETEMLILEAHEQLAGAAGCADADERSHPDATRS